MGLRAQRADDIDNISIVNNYRSQFGRILSRPSFAELLQKISDKVD